MNNIEPKLNKRELQEKITRNTKYNTALTDDWLRDNGLSELTFTTEKLNTARAKSISHTLLTQHLELLTTCQIKSLTDFQQAASKKRESKRITNAFCYCVMNINASINRKLFKQHRKLGMQRSV